MPKMIAVVFKHLPSWCCVGLIVRTRKFVYTKFCLKLRCKLFRVDDNFQSGGESATFIL